MNKFTKNILYGYVGSAVTGPPCLCGYSQHGNKGRSTRDII